MNLGRGFNQVLKVGSRKVINNENVSKKIIYKNLDDIIINLPCEKISKMNEFTMIFIFH